MLSIASIVSVSAAAPSISPPPIAEPLRDPIFAALDAHAAAFKIWDAATDRLYALEEALGAGREEAWPPAEQERFAALEATCDGANAALRAARMAVCRTVATTLPGVVAFVGFVAREIFNYDLGSPGEAEERAAMVTLDRAVRGLAAAPAGAMVLDPALAGDPDAALLALGAEAEALLPQIEAAGARFRALDALQQGKMDERPDALRVRAGDEDIVPVRIGGDYLNGGHVERVRTWLLENRALPGDASTVSNMSAQRRRGPAVKRGREIVEAYDAWRASLDRHADDIGLKEADEAYDALLGDLDALEGNMQRIPATTLAGLAAKARLFKWRWDRDTVGVPEAATGTADLPFRLAVNVANDLAAMPRPAGRGPGSEA